jgi:hypothetical protein
MRRRLRQSLPALRFVYGITWDELARMPWWEIRGYMDHLKKLPPPGWVYMGQPPTGRVRG